MKLRKFIKDSIYKGFLKRQRQNRNINTLIALPDADLKIDENSYFIQVDACSVRFLMLWNIFQITLI